MNIMATIFIVGYIAVCCAIPFVVVAAIEDIEQADRERKENGKW
jgi:hypothetical protein